MTEVPPELRCSPGELSTFCDQVYEEYHDDCGGNRRNEARRMVSLPMQVQPLDETYHPQGDELTAVSRDISSGGIGFFCTRPIPARLVRIRMSTPSGRELVAAARVVHTTRLGEFCLHGCQFLSED